MDGSRWSSSKARLTSSISASEKIRQDVTQNYEKITLLFANEKKRIAKTRKLLVKLKSVMLEWLFLRTVQAGHVWGPNVFDKI